MTSLVFKILKELDNAKIHYFIERHRLDTIDITATLLGCRVEISVFEDEHFEISKFTGNEDVLDENEFYDFIKQEKADNDMVRKVSD